MKLPHRKAPSSFGFIEKFYQTFNDLIIPSLKGIIMVLSLPVHLKYVREYRQERNLSVNDNPICRTEKETQMYRTVF